MPDSGITSPAPRGRSAPPPEVRRTRQRLRLFGAAARVFARLGYAEASTEAITREAHMSKATFYEHFHNKEECLLALFDLAAEGIAANIREVADATYPTYEARIHAGVSAFIAELTRRPQLAQALIVEVVGAGPRAMARRDATLQAYADWLYADNARAAQKYGVGTFASPDDAYAIMGAIFELVSRQLRTGRPEASEELAPVIERLLLGALRPPRR